MAHALVWSDAAASDLHAIAAYIALDNPSAASTVVRSVLAKLDSVADFPHGHRVVPEFGIPILREIVMAPYRIVYWVDDETESITILRIWHSSRGVPEVELPTD